LNAEGGYLAAANKGFIVLGLPDPGAVNLNFTSGGVADSDKNTNLIFTFTESDLVQLPVAAQNPGRVALKISPTTGAVSGSFTLVETAPRLTRSKVAFQGQIVRQSNGQRKAVGYFLLPQIPAPGQAASRAPILSGGFSLDEPGL
jgi:hypothetical protein